MSFCASLVIAVLYFAKTRGDSSEDRSSFGFNNPSTVNFNEIFSNSLSMLNDEALTTVNKDEEFHLNNLPSRFVEFQHLTTTVPTTTFTTTPSPRFLTAAYLKTTSKTKPKTKDTFTTSTNLYITSTTESPEEQTIKVLPLENRGRGVLDLLFPASRVRGFKNVFETFRRLLSNTF